MKQAVIMNIRGRQAYLDQDPEVIELVTQGILEKTEKGWKVSYEESDLTGLAGVTTTFFVEPEQVTLQRRGALRSQMVFRLGCPHESLYQMEFGALMMKVCAKRLSYDLTPEGGTIDLAYSIEIEHNAAGTIEYNLQIRPAA